VEAAFFDLDKTVIAKASLLAFGRTFYKEGLVTRRDVIRSIYAQLVYRYFGANEKRLSKLQRAVSGLTLGWDQKMVIRVVTDALVSIVEPLLYKEAVDLIEQHKRDGRLVYLVSASPLEIVTPMAQFLKVDGSISSKPCTDEQGHYTGEMEFYAYGPYKAEAMVALAHEKGIDLQRSFAYSDSYTDIPMLERVGYPVAVNPDRVLARKAKESGWQIMKFEERMPLSEGRSSYGKVVAISSLSVGTLTLVVLGGLIRRKKSKPVGDC
jgi:HAD superfamily hydrolase (TIGR01490 family)